MIPAGMESPEFRAYLVKRFGLPPRLMEAMLLAGRGYCAKQIASEMKVSHRTSRAHVQRVCGALKIRHHYLLIAVVWSAFCDFAELENR